MSDSLANRICTIIAAVLRAPPENVRPEASLALVARQRPAIAEAVRRHVGVFIEDEAVFAWADVADVIASAEIALAEDVRYAAAPRRAA